MELAWEAVRRYVEANAKNLVSGERMQDGSDDQPNKTRQLCCSRVGPTNSGRHRRVGNILVGKSPAWNTRIANRRRF